MICQACNGVIGRECWNPQECQQITDQMQNEAYRIVRPLEPSGGQDGGGDCPISDLERLDHAAEALSHLGRIGDGNAVIVAAIEIADLRRRLQALASPAPSKEAIARVIDPLLFELKDALDNAEGEPEQLRRDATEHHDRKAAATFAKADAVLALFPRPEDEGAA